MELLAPCGNADSFYAAVNNGANAVYLGLDNFSARQNAQNFTLENLRFYITYAKNLNVKVYVALNTLIKQAETNKFLYAAAKAYEYGADALILQDIFLGKLLKENIPDITLHLSTQAGVNNLYGAITAKKFGFSRVVLARETGIEDIKDISAFIETEVFVQGALCTSFSGGCYMSSFAGKNSGNRGLCKQPCRKKYTFLDKDGSVLKDEAYNISLSDLSLGAREISALENAGVSSLKIEGRMRRSEYVAAALKYFSSIAKDKSKNYLNGLLNDKPEKYFSALKRTYNRGDYTPGYLFGQHKNLISDKIQGHKGEFVGTITRIVGKRAFVKSDFCPSVNDAFKAVRNLTNYGSLLYNGESDNGGKTINNKHPQTGFYTFISGDVKAGDGVYITTDNRLNKELLSAEKKIIVSVTAKMLTGKQPELTAECSNVSACVKGESVLERASTAPLTEKILLDNLNKTDIYPYNVSLNSFESDGVFINSAYLNKLRRLLYEKLFYSLNPLRNFKEIVVNHSTMSDIVYQKRAVILSEFHAVDADILIYSPADYNDLEKAAKFSKKTKMVNKQCFLYLPSFLSGNDFLIIDKAAEYFDGFYCQGIYGFSLKERYPDKVMFYGSGCNIFNSAALPYLKDTYFCASKELTIKEAENLKDENSFMLSLGNIEVMQLIYCPFGSNCANCNIPDTFIMQDENFRKFLVRHYRLSGCRFIVYNCADLVLSKHTMNALYNFTLYDGDTVYKTNTDAGQLKELLKPYTAGHGIKGIL